MRIMIIVQEGSRVRELAEAAGALASPGTTFKVVSLITHRPLPPPPPPPWSPSVWITSEELAERARTVATRSAERIASSVVGVGAAPADTEVRTGTARDEILAAAADWSPDLIVVGAEGGGSILERWAAARVARTLVARAPCSVYVVRSMDRREEQGIASAMGSAVEGSIRART